MINSERVSRIACFALAALLAGCQFQWDDLGGDLPLVGAPLPLASLEKLNNAPTPGVRFAYDRQDRPYLTMWEPFAADDGTTSLGLHIKRLQGPKLDYTLLASEVYISTYSFYVLSKEETGPNPDDFATRLNTIDVGELGKGRNFLVPNGPALLFPSDDDRAIFYIVQDADVTEYDLIKLDGSFRRKIPLPPMVSPIDPLSTMTFFFTGEGDEQYLVLRDPSDEVTLYSTHEVREIALGKLPGTIWVLQSIGRAFACGALGLISVKLDGTDPQVLDARTCATSFTQLGLTDSFVYYGVDDRLQRIPVTGGMPESISDDPRRLLAIARDGDGVEHIITSGDPSSRYSNGAGSGFVDGWQFMERGRGSRYSFDLSRVFWIEHAALPSGVGDLLTATNPRGAPLRLARNVRRFNELSADGRILANSNYAFRGTQNRLVVIDLDKREQRWVADAVSDYHIVPGTDDEVILEIVSGPDNVDIYRAKIPR